MLAGASCHSACTSLVPGPAPRGRGQFSTWHPSTPICASCPMRAGRVFCVGQRRVLTSSPGEAILDPKGFGKPLGSLASYKEVCDNGRTRGNSKEKKRSQVHGGPHPPGGPGKDRRRRWWVEDGAAAVENMLIASTALGYGSCWLEGYTLPREEEFKKLLGIPEKKRLLTLVPIGVPAEWPTREKKALEEVLHWERY
jgi:hypothetical protein